MNGEEAVIGTVLMLINENSRIVAQDVSAKHDQVSKTLPPGIEVKIVLHRAKLVHAAVGTVALNLTQDALLVAASPFLLLGNCRAAIIATLVIPFRSDDHAPELHSLMRISYPLLYSKTN